MTVHGVLSLSASSRAGVMVPMRTRDVCQIARSPQCTSRPAARLYPGYIYQARCYHDMAPQKIQIQCIVLISLIGTHIMTCSRRTTGAKIRLSSISENADRLCLASCPQIQCVNATKKGLLLRWLCSSCTFFRRAPRPSLSRSEGCQSKGTPANYVLMQFHFQAFHLGCSCALPVVAPWIPLQQCKRCSPHSGVDSVR